MNSVVYQNDAEVLEVVRKFEFCSFALQEFNHPAHLTVALAYLHQCSSPQEALDRMRSGLLKFSAHHGKVGYHETITRFWLTILENFRTCYEYSELYQIVNAAVPAFQKQLLEKYYSAAAIASDHAKREWLEPDLRPLRD